MSNPTSIIVLGITGDLAKRHLIPALYSLYQKGLLPREWMLFGVGQETTSTEHIFKQAQQFITTYHEQTWQSFQKQGYYYQADLANSHDILSCKHVLVEQEKQLFGKPANRLVYLALPPHLFAPVTQQLAAHDIIRYSTQTKAGAPWHRVAYEKPFGWDAASAKTINACIHEYLDETQIFRVDHYLAKDIVSSLATLRFTNRVFESLWNHEHIDWIEISLNEQVDVRTRGAFYDQLGALKDVVQNHMLQIMALIAMEAPPALVGNPLRDKKADILQKIEPCDGILGQYEGYRTHPGIAPNSTTETFAALKLIINTPRWHRVPFYLKTGKCLPEKSTMITVQFKPASCPFAIESGKEANSLVIQIVPKAGFSLHLHIKKPGLHTEDMPAIMDFCYECIEGTNRTTYELVLYEVMQGEQSISVRFDEIEYAWNIIDAIKQLHFPLYTYNKGSTGPMQLEAFAQKHSMRWQS